MILNTPYMAFECCIRHSWLTFFFFIFLNQPVDIMGSFIGLHFQRVLTSIGQPDRAITSVKRDFVLLQASVRVRCIISRALMPGDATCSSCHMKAHIGTHDIALGVKINAFGGFQLRGSCRPLVG